MEDSHIPAFCLLLYFQEGIWTVNPFAADLVLTMGLKPAGASGDPLRRQHRSAWRWGLGNAL